MVKYLSVDSALHDLRVFRAAISNICSYIDSIDAPGAIARSKGIVEDIIVKQSAEDVSQTLEIELLEIIHEYLDTLETIEAHVSEMIEQLNDLHSKSESIRAYYEEDYIPWIKERLLEFTLRFDDYEE